MLRIIDTKSKFGKQCIDMRKTALRLENQGWVSLNDEIHEFLICDDPYQAADIEEEHKT